MNTELIGWLATVLGIISFVPQTLKVYKTDDTKSISLGMYIIITISFGLWIYYGFVLNLKPILYGNMCIIIMSIYILITKIHHLRREKKILYDNLL